MIELLLLLLFLEKDIYLKYRYKVRLREEDREVKYLYQALDKIMEMYNRDLTLDEFTIFVTSLRPELTPFLQQLRDNTVGKDMLQSLLIQVSERSQAHELALMAIEVSEGKKPFTNLLDMASNLNTEEAEIKEDEFVTDDLEVIYNETIHTPGLRWRLQALNQSLGSLRKGDFGFVFARPETGKTTFLASEVSFMAGQVSSPILWCNNEEAGNKVKSRIIQASLGCTTQQMFAHRQRAYEKYMELTKGHIKLKDGATISKREIEHLCESINPSLIVLDQIDKLKGFNDDREDLRLGAIYIWAREIAKEYCPVIGICQADVSGEGKKYLTMENVANAKTAKQAEADWILGIGTTHDEGLKFIRYLHLSKNKLTGDEDTIPELRHGRMEVLIQPELARYKDFD